MFRSKKPHRVVDEILKNHPSGEIKPSQEDLFITRKLVEAGKLLDIDIPDHITIGKEKFESLKKEESYSSDNKYQFAYQS